MLSKVKGVTFQGFDVIPVSIEVNVARGLPAFEIVGLPNKSVEESKHRIKSALTNSGYKFPDGRITVNLAPADIKKAGSSFDLGIAAGIYCAQNGINYVNDVYFFGELSLDGIVHAVRGSYLALEFVNSQAGMLFISLECQKLFYDFSQARIFAVDSLRNAFYVIQNLTTRAKSLYWDSNHVSNRVSKQLSPPPTFDMTLTDIVGQHSGKRALEIAAAGGHNVMLVGSPGTGKSMLARSIISILPVLNSKELRETRRIQSFVTSDISDIYMRPFRAPHHTISYAGMIGGGADPQPGEITLAHKGVLFMDEFCEFSRNVLESLRQPLQDKFINIIRVNQTYRFPCDFFLIAASNPCPCGYLGHAKRSCICSEQKIAIYTKKLSGPLADRFDLFVSVFPEEEFINEVNALHNLHNIALKTVQDKVFCARELQSQRLHKYNIDTNASMTNKIVHKEVPLSADCKKLLNDAYKKFSFSPRVYYKLIKVARTIADLSLSSQVKYEHLAEAIQYRQK